MTEKSILLVEDEGLIALHITELLERAGYHVATTNSGETVLKELETPPVPDLILMDIALAGALDGIETARRITRHYRIPIIFLTAYSDPHRIEKAQEISPFGYLIKPVMDDELFAVINRALDNQGT